jgi:hypothetical protein
MRLNCRPGDLAILVRAHPVASACIGRVVRLVGVTLISGSPAWSYEGMPWRGGSPMDRWTWYEIPDAWLRPIRDNDGEDESFRWAPAPEKVLA